MVNTQSLLVCVIGIKELQVKGFLKCQLKAGGGLFPCAFSGQLVCIIWLKWVILGLILDWVVLKCTSRSCIILKSMSWNLENRLAYLTSDYCKDNFKLITSSNQMINKEMCPRWSLFFHLPLENQFSLEFSTLDKTLDSLSEFSFVPF